jgi:hypothetical protein
MREFLTMDNAAAIMDVYLRQKKPGHKGSTLTLQQQAYPFPLSSPLQHKKTFRKTAENILRFGMQDSRQNEISMACHPRLQRLGKLDNGFGGEIGDYDREAPSN